MRHSQKKLLIDDEDIEILRNLLGLGRVDRSTEYVSSGLQTLRFKVEYLYDFGDDDFWEEGEEDLEMSNRSLFIKYLKHIKAQTGHNFLNKSTILNEMFEIEELKELRELLTEK